MGTGSSHPSRLGRWGKNLLAFLLGLAFVLAPLEVGLRVVHRSADPRVLVYPRVATDINGFKDPGFERHVPPGEYRILALGASAFVTREFRRRFEAALNEAPWFREQGLRVRVISSGEPAHMSWDSMWKYRDWYRGYDFDLVLFYHGINDARANACPRHVFRPDYSHMPYYAQYAPVTHWIESHPVLSRSFALTFGRKLVARARVQWVPRFQRQAPYNDPADDPWLPEAADIKTVPTFEGNVEEIASLARERRQRLLLLTYAHHLPADYSHAAFLEQRLDYSFAEESVPVAIWGLPENVQAAIEAHNDATRRVAARHPEALFFDMARFMPRDAAHFIDVCHWTDLGLETFAAGVVAALAEAP